MRGRFRLDGLLPSGGACTPEVEVARAKAAVERACSPLDQYQVSVDESVWISVDQYQASVDAHEDSNLTISILRPASPDRRP